MVGNSFNNSDKTMTTKESPSNRRRSGHVEGEKLNSTQTKRRSRFNKSLKKNEDEQKNSQKPKKKIKYRKRMFPIILRVIFILLLFAGSLVLGLMFGYGILGQEEAKEVLDKSVWQHILNIMKAE